MASRKRYVCIGVFFVWLMCAGSASAVGALPSGEMEWIWQGAGSTIALNFEPIWNPGEFIDYSFGLAQVGVENSYFELLDASKYNATINIFESNGSYLAQIAGGDTVNLGSTASFEFRFYEAGVYYSTYAIYSGSTGSGAYLLANNATGAEITMLTQATPSAVPIPGSILLLGSSVLGLLGIASRKNRS